jgi:hypothetical protein
MPEHPPFHETAHWFAETVTVALLINLPPSGSVSWLRVYKIRWKQATSYTTGLAKWNSGFQM